MLFGHHSNIKHARLEVQPFEISGPGAACHSSILIPAVILCFVNPPFGDCLSRATARLVSFD